MDAGVTIFFPSLHVNSTLRYPSIVVTNHHHHHHHRTSRTAGSNLLCRPATLLKNTNNKIIPLTSNSRASGAAVTDQISSAIITTTTTTSEQGQAEITWQIVIGAIAGVAPFVVAGIEFSKRIVQQRKCNVCKGSGLVLRDNKYYFRCPRCGGFLPWQSWTRFFTG